MDLRTGVSGSVANTAGQPATELPADVAAVDGQGAGLSSSVAAAAEGNCAPAARTPDRLSATGKTTGPCLGRPAEPSTPAGALLPLPVKSAKMGPYDNPEAFLTTSKRVVLASQWPLEH